MCLLNIHVPQQRRLRGQLIEVFKYLHEFTNASARGLLDYDLNDRTRNNGAKRIEKHFNSSVAQHFYQIKITSTWNAPPSEVVSSRTANSLKNSLDKHWQIIPQMSVWTGSNHRCRAQSKGAQTVVGQRFDGNGSNGLSYYYYNCVIIFESDYTERSFGKFCHIAHCDTYVTLLRLWDFAHRFVRKLHIDTLKCCNLS